MILLASTFYEVIRNLVTKKCQDQFGVEFNSKRHQLNIPSIPENWQIKRSDEIATLWISNTNLIGHQSKTVAYLKCSIEGELDNYKLKSQNGRERWIEIENKYATPTHKGSAIYTYQIDHSSKEISKDVADSIFKSENINRDY